MCLIAVSHLFKGIVAYLLSVHWISAEYTEMDVWISADICGDQRQLIDTPIKC